MGYGMDYRALETGWVSQGAADYCKAHGHATYTVDGVNQGYCPRCLMVTHPTTGECPTCSDEFDTYVTHAHDGDPSADWETALMEAAARPEGYVQINTPDAVTTYPEGR